MRVMCFAFLALACGANAQNVTEFVIEENSPAIRDGHLVEPIGIETLGGVFAPLLETGCKLPCEKTSIFSTAEDNQTRINVSIYRGDADLVAKNQELARLAVAGIPAAPRGQPKVAITIGAVGDDLLISASESSGAWLHFDRQEP